LFFDKANLPISGIQLIFLVILIGVPLSGRSLEKRYDNINPDLER
jgi:hypothetical protein